jgi:hypothetical protein
MRKSELLLIAFFGLKINISIAFLTPSRAKECCTGRAIPVAATTISDRTRITKQYQTSRSKNGDLDLVSLEREVLASTLDRMDRKLVAQALLAADPTVSDETTVDEQIVVAEQWKVALAAALASALLGFIAAKSLVFAALSFVVVFFLANGDPLEDGVAGAFARILGRLTIKSVNASTPKIQAMARAAITSEEEITVLKEQTSRLQEENNRLVLWKQRRIAVDESLSNYGLEELKETARQNNIPVGGNKTQLLMRLVEAEVIQL